MLVYNQNHMNKKRKFEKAIWLVKLFYFVNLNV